MTSYFFETIPFAGGAGAQEQEWLGQELAFEQEDEYGRAYGSPGRGRRPRRFRPKPRPLPRRRPAWLVPAVEPAWAADPGDEPSGALDGPPSTDDSFPPAPADPGPLDSSGDAAGDEPGELRGAPCKCAACQRGARASAEQEYWSGEGDFGFAPERESLFETLEFAAPSERETCSPPGRPVPASASCAIGFVDCPPAGTPSVVLGGFGFDKSALTPPHAPLIQALARRIAASQATPRPIRSLLIAGHTDAVGDDNYNFGLARRRAETVARALCRTIERLRPGGTRGLSVSLTSCGERQTRARPEQSRRVEIFLPGAPARPGRKNPPDHSHCGVPRHARQREAEFEAELRAEYQAELAAELEAEFEAPSPPRRARPQTVQPRLCLFQNHPTTAVRNHFHHQANRWARRISAQASPTTQPCPRRVGPTPYDTGADIIAAIDAAHRCRRRRLDAVHIFSHSGFHGVFGTTAAAAGLYMDTDAQARTEGARTAADIPTAALAENVVFVLHGCNTASETDNFARTLYNHLAASLRDPKVFGHTNSGCAGRDNSWREYSRRSPNGTVRRRTLKPHYEGNGGCDPPARKP
jgi:hypothetical protein